MNGGGPAPPGDQPERQGQPSGEEQEPAPPRRQDAEEARPTVQHDSEAAQESELPAGPQAPGPAPPWWPTSEGLPPPPHTPAANTGPGQAEEEHAEPQHPFLEPEPQHRLSPLTMITEPVRYLKNFIIPLAIVVIWGTTAPGILVSAVVVTMSFIVAGFVTYQTFRYQVGSERMEIRQGLLNRSRRTIPLERIRGVDVTSTLVHRMLGLAVVRVEAAAGGGGAEEGKLDAVSRKEAERLREVLLQRRAVLRSQPELADQADHGGEQEAPPALAGEAQGPETGPQGRVHFRMAGRWHFYGALSMGYLLTPFVALAALFGLAGQALGQVQIDADEAQTTVERLLGTLDLPAVWLWAGLAALLLAMPIFAVVSYTVNHWGFTLRGREESLVAERGLFTRQSVTLEHRRIRGHEIVDTPLERLGVAARLRAIVTGLGNAATRAVLLPITPRRRLEQVVADALFPFGGELRGHPPAALARRLFRAVVPFLVLALAAWALELYWAVWPLLVLAALGLPLGWDRYRSLGHGDDGRSVSVRSGSLRREQAVVLREAIIGWRWSQTIFQRRAGLATLTVTVGAGSGGYPAIDAGFEESVDFAAGISPQMVGPFLERPAWRQGRNTGGEGPDRAG